MWKWWKEMKQRSPWQAPVCLTRCNQEILENCSSSQVFPNLNSPQVLLKGTFGGSLWRFLTGFAKSQPSLSYISFVDSRPPRWNNQMSWSPNPPDPTCANRACTLIRNPGISARLIPGPPGCGKSTMASLISKRENRVFYEGKLFSQEFIAGQKVWKLTLSRWWFPPRI